jgi:hypothetical protein
MSQLAAHPPEASKKPACRASNFLKNNKNSFRDLLARLMHVA